MTTLTTKLLCLHGFSQNGTVLSQHMQPLFSRLPTGVVGDFPDAPHDCSPASVERLYSFLKTERTPEPYRCFWDATDDGRIYRGWPETRALLAQHAQGAQRLGVFGFSQGAIVATALCALAAAGQFPRIDFAVLVAGRAPRSDELRPLLQQPLNVPSLHVWGERDFGLTECRALTERFEPTVREVIEWPGPHVVPTRGPAAERMLSFIAEHALAQVQTVTDGA